MHVLFEKLAAFATAHPGAEALVIASMSAREQRYRTVSYAQLLAAVSRYRAVLCERALRAGERVLLLVPPGEQLVAWSYAVMAANAIPVFLDPAMGAANLRRSITLAAPDALVGAPLAHLLRMLWRTAFRNVRFGVVVRDAPLSTAPETAPRDALVDHDADETPDVAGIMFTSGGTGRPKGAIYRQETVRSQFELLASATEPVPGSRDLPLLPAFALANAAAGVCSVFLRPAPRTPLAFDARAVVAIVNELQVRSSFGSPALWEKIAAECLRSGALLPHVEHIFIAGAPVTALQAARVQSVAPRAAVFMPYGCTEALPITFPRAFDYAGAGAVAAHGGELGTWIGCAVEGVDVAIAAVRADPASGANELERLPEREIGEIVVRGPNVAPAYAGPPEETRAAKIDAADGAWHRTGDVGYHDGRGNLYFLGRTLHLVRGAERTYYPIAVEGAFNRDPRVRRSALVGLDGGVRPAIVIEPHPEHWPRSRSARERFAAELRALVARDPLAAGIREVFFHRAFPVDPRHNAKIQRTQLARWASRSARTR